MTNEDDPKTRERSYPPADSAGVQLTDEQLANQALAKLREVQGPDAELTPTLLWHYRVCTRNGQEALTGDPGRALFYSDPPVEGETKTDKTKVLVCSTLGEAEVTMRRAQEDAERLHIADANFVFSKNLGTFWTNFFGCKDYIDDTDRRKPALIVASGNLRNYSDYGGETVSVAERLQKICADWEVPLELP